MIYNCYHETHISLLKQHPHGWQFDCIDYCHPNIPLPKKPASDLKYVLINQASRSRN